jgi:hypothetical protein
VQGGIVIATIIPACKAAVEAREGSSVADPRSRASGDRPQISAIGRLAMLWARRGRMVWEVGGFPGHGKRQTR